MTGAIERELATAMGLCSSRGDEERVAEAQAELARLRAENADARKWILPSEGMPEEGQHVILSVSWEEDEDDGVIAGIRSSGLWIGTWFDDTDPFQEIFGEVRAWMPFPTPLPRR